MNTVRQILLKDIYSPLTKPLFESHQDMVGELVDMEGIEDKKAKETRTNGLKSLMSFVLSGKKPLPNKVKENLKTILLKKLDNVKAGGEIISRLFSEIEKERERQKSMRRVQSSADQNPYAKYILSRVSDAKRVIVTSSNPKKLLSSDKMRPFIEAIVHDINDAKKLTQKTNVQNWKEYFFIFPKGGFFPFQSADDFWNLLHENLMQVSKNPTEKLSHVNRSEYSIRVRTYCADNNLTGISSIIFNPVFKPEEWELYNYINLEEAYILSSENGIFNPVHVDVEDLKYFKKGLLEDAVTKKGQELAFNDEYQFERVQEKRLSLSKPGMLSTF
jgi:hypothetical protein